MLPLASTLHSMLFSSVFCGEWKIPGLFQALGMAFITQLLSDLFMFKKKRMFKKIKNSAWTIFIEKGV